MPPKLRIFQKTGFFGNLEGDDVAPTFNWDTISRTFIKPSRTSFTGILPAAGVWGQMELLYVISKDINLIL